MRGGLSTLPTRFPIHREAPLYDEQSTEQEILETGIKVVDLLAPYARGGKIGLFGGAGVGKTVLIMELINNVAKGTQHNNSDMTTASLSTLPLPPPLLCPCHSRVLCAVVVCSCSPKH